MSVESEGELPSNPDDSTTDVVVITGCSSGIGEATARALLNEGWTVHATARNIDDLKSLETAGCYTHELDVTKTDQVSTVVDQIVDEHGRIDCLVNNAGIGIYGPIEDISLQKFHKQFDVNVYGPTRLIRAALPVMRVQQEGTIINISSYLGRLTIPGSGAYSGSKYALEAISDALRIETKQCDVNVVLIEPGPVSSEFHEKIRKYHPAKSAQTPAYDAIYELISDGSMITQDGPLTSSPEAVAETIVNAASCKVPKDRYIVGTFANIMLWLRYLPVHWRDKLYHLAIKLIG